MSNKNPIGLFDSGVGGTSIWKEVHTLLPNESTIYLADSKNAPYGQKSQDEIIALSIKNTEILLNNNVIAITQQNEFVLSRDLARLTLKEVRALLGASNRMPEVHTELQSLPWLVNAKQHLGELDILEAERLNLSVEAFFDGR